MFQLIVAVISIALVAALAIASIYYGGEAFTKSSLRAQVTTLVNGGQQISGAVALYNTDYPGKLQSGPAVTALGASYLSAEPGHTPFVTEINGVDSVWAVDTATKTAKIAIDGTEEICNEVARQAGANAGVPTSGQFYCNAGATEFLFKL